MTDDTQTIIILVCVLVIAFLLWTVRQQGAYLSMLGAAHNELRRVVSADLVHLNERFIEATGQRGIASFATPTTSMVPPPPHDVDPWPNVPDDPNLPPQ